jgi:CheY-like chemotaxis protein
MDNVQLLLADGDARIRSLLASCAREVVEGLDVIEAGDGAEAVQLGLQERPQVALLDLDLPTLGGVEVAVTLRELQPQMRVALQAAEVRRQRDRLRARRLPLFDKLEPARALSWLEVQLQACADVRLQPKRSLECSWCGYGIHCVTPPERCPMCHVEDAWIRESRRAIRRAVASV